MPRDRLAASRIEYRSDDLQPVEIEGLSWLVSSPKLRVTVIDERGYPVELSVPDPRAFAAHKLWLSSRPDRNLPKARRDEAQARLLIALVRDRLPASRFEDPALTAIPRALCRAAEEIASVRSSHEGRSRSIEPGW